jgi:phospholipid/cholesterol/gamma-HCH transport system permease protein
MGERMNVQMLARRQGGGDVFRLVGAGEWIARNAGRLEQRLDELLAGISTSREAELDLGGVEKFDSFGLLLLARTRRELAAGGRKVSISGLGAQESALLERLEAATGDELKKTQLGQTGGGKSLSLGETAAHWLEKTGRAMAAMVSDLLAFAALFGELVMAMGRVIRHPRKFRLTAAIHQLDRTGWQAVPIILLITFLIGAIIAQQGIFHFRKFGAELYVVDMVSILVLREIGVLLVAIMVAGRSGSSFTAELGSMKMREEIDALRTMGFNPVDILILPRVLTLIIALPLLTFIGSMAALYGGGLVAWAYAGMSPDLFIERLRDVISLDHFKVGMIKAPFMGAIIGIIATTEGLRTQGSAESLGRQTTRSVVKSIFMVIVLDGLFAVFFASIGI